MDSLTDKLLDSRVLRSDTRLLGYPDEMHTTFTLSGILQLPHSLHITGNLRGFNGSAFRGFTLEPLSFGIRQPMTRFTPYYLSRILR